MLCIKKTPKPLIFILTLIALTLHSISIIAQTTSDSDLITIHNEDVLSLLIPQHKKVGGYTTFNEASTLQNLETAKTKNDHRLIGKYANSLGMLKLWKGDGISALKYFSLSTSAFQKIKNDQAIAISLVQQGVAYQLLGEHQKAIKKFDSGLSIAKKMKLLSLEGAIYSLSGKSYGILNDLKTSIEKYNKAIVIYDKQKDNLLSASTRNDIGEVYLKFNDYKNAISNFQSSLTYLKSNLEPQLEATIYRNIGLVSFKRRDYENALPNFKKSLSFSNQLIVHKLIKDCYLQLFTYYGFKNEYKKADFYHEKYRSLKDSLNKIDPPKLSVIRSKANVDEREEIIEMLKKQNEKQAKLVAQTQLELSNMITKTDVELQSKDQKIQEQSDSLTKANHKMAIAELDLEKKKSELQRQENFRNLFVIIAIAAILGVALIYNRSQIKQKANRDLKLKNDELAATLKKLEQTQDQLVHSQKMASLGELTAGIAHEIQNPLNFVTNFSTTAIDLINDINNENDAAEKQSLETDLIQVIEKINHHSKRADKIVKNMLLHARVGTEEKELVNIPNLIDEIVDLAYHGVQNKTPSFKCEIVKEYDKNLPTLLINRQEIGRVFLNLIGNSFYAINKRKNNEVNSSYTPLLKVSTATINNKLLITISDNGIGIPTETLNKVFEPFYTTKPAGEGTGLGLSISYDIITLGHQGKITVESELNKLTSFKIELPLS